MSMPPDAQLTHVGILVDDMAAMVAFYTDVLGLLVVDQGENLGRTLTFLSRNAGEHHQLVLVTGRQAARDVRLLGQVSFRVAGLDELRWFSDRAAAAGAAGLEARNHGNSWSIYFEDPEGNRVEVYCTTPWHVRQPWRVPLDLSQSNAEIAADTERVIRAEADWQPVEEWRAGLATRLAGGR
jgi:catechol 2,3-dioxygenase